MSPRRIVFGGNLFDLFEPQREVIDVEYEDITDLPPEETTKEEEEKPE